MIYRNHLISILIVSTTKNVRSSVTLTHVSITNINRRYIIL